MKQTLRRHLESLKNVYHGELYDRLILSVGYSYRLTRENVDPEIITYIALNDESQPLARLLDEYFREQTLPSIEKFQLTSLFFE